MLQISFVILFRISLNIFSTILFILIIVRLERLSLMWSMILENYRLTFLQE